MQLNESPLRRFCKKFFHRYHLSFHRNPLSKVIITDALTNLLLDQMVNKVIEAEMFREWENWISHGLHSCMKTFNMKRATIEGVVGWINKSLNLWKQTIVLGFKWAKVIGNHIPSDSDKSDYDNDVKTNVNLDQSFINYLIQIAMCLILRIFFY